MRCRPVPCRTSVRLYVVPGHRLGIHDVFTREAHRQAGRCTKTGSSEAIPFLPLPIKGIYRDDHRAEEEAERDKEYGVADAVKVNDVGPMGDNMQQGKEAMTQGIEVLVVDGGQLHEAHALVGIIL